MSRMMRPQTEPVKRSGHQSEDERPDEDGADRRVVLILVVGHDKPIREAKHRVANPIALDDERNHS